MEGLSQEEFEEALKAECKAAGGLRALAEKTGLSTGYLSHIFNGKRRFGPKAQEKLGWRRVEVVRWFKQEPIQ